MTRWNYFTVLFIPGLPDLHISEVLFSDEDPNKDLPGCFFSLSTHAQWDRLPGYSNFRDGLIVWITHCLLFITLLLCCFSVSKHTTVYSVRPAQANTVKTTQIIWIRVGSCYRLGDVALSVSETSWICFVIKIMTFWSMNTHARANTQALSLMPFAHLFL